MWGVCWSVFNDKLKSGKVQKLRTYILIQKTQVHCNVTFRKTRCLHIYVFAGLVEMSMSACSMILDFGSTEVLKWTQEESEIRFEEHDVSKVRNLKIKNVRKDACRNPGGPSNQILKILKMGSMSIKNYWMEILVTCQPPFRGCHQAAKLRC